MVTGRDPMIEYSLGGASSSQQPAPVLLYDGVCAFCNGAVRTVLRLDRRGVMRFAAIDSDYARAVVARHPALQSVDSMILIEDPGQTGERIGVKSTAALRVARYLGFPWNAALLLSVIPAPVRDWLYDRLASARYRLFGKYDTCPIPPPEVRARFIG
jgi:predicted DCC family thiol-disulfide oxidoreductase YuxK